MIALLWALIAPLPMTAMAQSGIDSGVITDQSASTAQLAIDEVLARIEATHFLFRATEIELSKAQAKILKSLRAWEPKDKK